MDINTRGKRLLFLTAIGIKLSFSGYFSSHKGKQYPRSVPRNNAPAIAAVRRELLLSRIVFATTILLAIPFPKFIFFGYLIAVTPVFNTIRIVLEHFEVRMGDGFQIATAYKTGVLTRYAFFWVAGDCHIVHNLFPRIPFYRISAALRSMTPILQSAGVIQRRSLIELLYFWLLLGSPHRTLLPLDASRDQHA